MVEISESAVEACRFSWNKEVRRLTYTGIWELFVVKPVVVETAVGKLPSLRRRNPSSIESESESRCSVVEGGEGESTVPTK
jgi:hypothetical protein